ncbi:MAG: hypothetical protein HYS20_15500 [Rhodocyclales bacterium]|nr:hypothetical protein [Rhodocyclales bacterium]
MVYVRRDESGNIVALSTAPPHDAADAQWQFVDPRDPAVLAFAGELTGDGSVAPVRKATVHPVYVAPNKTAENLCALGVDETDIALIRVIEDLIDTLINRGLIRFTDLPVAAQIKLTERRSWRSSMRDTQLLDDDEHAI